MTNQLVSISEDLIKGNLGYSSSYGTAMIKDAAYSCHLSSRYTTKSRIIIHVTIRPVKNSSCPKENKSEDLSDEETLQRYQLSSQVHDKPLTGEHPRGIILQKNHFSSKTNTLMTHTNWNIFGNNNKTTTKKDHFSNTRDLLDNSGRKRKKKNKCPGALICGCSWLFLFLFTALLLGLAITVALLVTLIKPNPTTTTTSEIATMSGTTLTTTAILPTITIISSTSTTSTTESTTETTTRSTSTTSTTLSTTSRTLSTTSTTLPTTTNVAVSASTSNYDGQEDITISCLTTLTNVTIQVFVQKTVGATYSGAYSTFWGGTINQSYTDTGTQIIYTWTIVNGQTIACSGGSYQAVAEFNLIGTSQITSADTYIVTTTISSGVTTTLSGHF